MKRVIGVAGDRISMRRNRLWLNGRAVAYAVTDPEAAGRLPDGRPTPVVLAEEALRGHPHAVTFTPGLRGVPDIAELVVPEGEVFFLGDNRDVSLDSRLIGTAPLEHVYGRVTHVALSLDPDASYRPRFERWFQAIR